MRLETLKARIREAGGPELLERLEWNISGSELAPLTDSGLFTPPEVESLIVARYERGVCRWHGGGEYPVRGVLDHAIDAGRFLSEVRRRAELRGVSFHDGHTLVGLSEGPRSVRLPRLTPAPRAPERRVVLVGDAAARHSPLTCCGFGGMMRSFLPGSRVLAEALARERFPPSMAIPSRAPERRDEVNQLLDTAFAVLHALGNDSYAALLKDRLEGRDFARLLGGIARRRPQAFRELRMLAHTGPFALARWLEGFSRLLLNPFLAP
ncbi:Lycopene cyclase CruA type [Cystobacter fuscus]|uniref:Lycopene cyclase CruA type n=1 Tax=Cystobacter fuscus TaxID=43 RepID=A0A250IYQ1_9BACT|nr:hypothetical protein [Cystobacter fuscus]ATB36869.1 Lycopene cyclase CruA type [Cystobacter fuscus]